MKKASLKKLNHYHKRFWKITSVVFVAAGVLSTITVLAGYYLTPRLANYENEILAALSNEIQHPVTIGNFSANWEGYGPVVDLAEIKIWDPAKESVVVSIKSAQVRINVLDLLRKRKVVLSSIELDDVETHLIQKEDGSVGVIGFENIQNSEDSDIYSTLEELTDQGDITISHAYLSLSLLSGETVFFQNIDVDLGRSLGKGHLEVSGDLVDTSSRGAFDISLVADIAYLEKKQWQGEFSASLKKAELNSWKRLWPTLPTEALSVQSGVGDMELTLLWKKNTLKRVETTVALEKLNLIWKDKKIELDSISGKGQARVTRKGWSIAGNTFFQPEIGGSFNANGSLLLADNKDDSEIDLFIKADDIPGIPAIKLVLPELNDEIPPQVINWIEEAIQAGKIDEIDAVIQGNLQEFPFAKGDGHFEIKADVSDAIVKFHPEWDPVSINEGQIHFKGDEFFAVIESGEIGGGQIVDAAVVIPELNPDRSDLNVTGILKGTAENAIAYLKKTPLWEELKAKLEPLTVKGPIEVSLDFDMPLGLPGGEKVVGAITLQNDSLQVSGLNFTELSGKMSFDDKGIYSDNIQGKLYQQPVQMQFATQSNENQPRFLKLALQGQIQASNLKKYYANALWNDWKGEAPYTVDVELRDDSDAKLSHVLIKSGLKGLEINLPAPFNKSAQTTEPFLFDLSFNSKNQHFQFHYDKAIRGNVYVNTQSKNTEIDKGIIEINPANMDTPIEMPNQGVQIIGELPILDLDGWSSRFSDMQGSKNQGLFPAMTGKLKMGSVLFMKQTLNVEMINFQRLSQEWKINFSGKEAQGQVVLPHELSSNPISLNLDYLYWKTAEDKTMGNPPPDGMPNFSIFIKRFILDDKDRGQIDVFAKMGKKSMFLNPLKVIQPTYAFSGAAYWDWASKPGLSTLKGNVNTSDLGAMLKDVGISNGVEGGKGISNLDLRWPGGLAAWNIDNVSGQVDLQWQNGRLVDVKPGIGRILSLFNVDVKSITRRLTLDFSDFLKKGFTFDKLTTHLNFNSGIISTKDGEVDSSSGIIKFNGKAFTVPQSLDFYLQVYPAISNSSTAIAAGVALANPIAGAAVWAANKVLAPATDKLISMNYHVTGPWSEPVITPINSKDVKNSKSSSSKK